MIVNFNNFSPCLMFFLPYINKVVVVVDLAYTSESCFHVDGNLALRMCCSCKRAYKDRKM